MRFPEWTSCGTSRTREAVGDWFGRHGWDVEVTPSDELMAGYGRRPPEEVKDQVPGNLFVSAQRT